MDRSDRWLIIVLERAEKEIELIKDGGYIKRETDIYHHWQVLTSIIWPLSGPPCFSLVNTFKPMLSMRISFPILQMLILYTLP
jgi:hypothetical protein